MKHFLLFYETSRDYLQKRAQYRKAHLEKAWASHSRGELKDRRPNLFPRVRAAGGTSASVRMDGASDYTTPMAPSPTAP